MLFLNPDCALVPGVVEHLMAEADARPSCVAIGPRIEDPDGATQGSARGDPDLLAGVAGRTGWLTRVLPSSAVVARQVIWPERVPPGQTSIEVDWLSGACLLVRRSRLRGRRRLRPRLLHVLGGRRPLPASSRAAAAAVRYAPGVRVRHVVGQSSRRAPELALRAFHASAYRYYTRWNAPRRWDPRRVIAKSLLTLRLWIKLAGAR